MKKKSGARHTHTHTHTRTRTRTHLVKDSLSKTIVVETKKITEAESVMERNQRKIKQVLKLWGTDKNTK